MKCELCKVEARIFCESDQASLCWTCDAKVHGANFLVARHSRTLLCSACNSPTPWKATGAALVNAVSVCHRCVGEQQQQQQELEESEGGNNDDTDIDDEEDDGVSGDEDGDNQVVPWFSSTPTAAASHSGCEESVDGDRDRSEPAATTTTTSSLKRRRQDDASDRDFQEEGSNGSVSRRWRAAVEEVVEAIEIE